MLFRNIALIFFGCLTFSTVSCELTIRYERFGEVKSRAEHADLHGLDVDFAKTLLAQTDCSYRFVELPWARALGGLKAGLIDFSKNIKDNEEEGG